MAERGSVMICAPTERTASDFDINKEMNDPPMPMAAVMNKYGAKLMPC